MVLRSKPYTSQKISAHSNTATGTASTRPRAKPGRPCARELPAEKSVSGHFIRIALSIMVRTLLLSVRIGQSLVGGARDPRLRQPGEAGGDEASACREAPAKERKFGILADVLLLTRFAMAAAPEVRTGAHRVIHVGSGRKAQRSKGLAPRVAVRVALFVLCGSAPRLAFAQDTNVVTPVQLFDPEAGPGLRVGPGFVLHPSVAADVTYDSNVYNVATFKTDDFIASVRPLLVLQSDWARHSLELSGSADVRRYFDTKDENSEEFDLAARSTLELGGQINVEPDVGYARLIEKRGTAGDQFLTDRPVSLYEKRAGLRISRDSGRLGISVEGSLVKSEYNDTSSGGIPVDLSTRDVLIRRGALRASLGISARTRVFAQLAGNEVDYDIKTATPRNSSGYALLGGFHLQVTSLIDLEAALGYIHQNFDNPAFKSVSAMNFWLTANWTPTPRWLITASAARTIDHSPRIDVPAIVRSEFSLEAKRAVTDRLMLGADAGFTNEKYWGSRRNDRRYEANVSAHYRLAGPIGVIARAGYRKQDGGAFGRDYEGVAASIGVRLAW